MYESLAPMETASHVVIWTQGSTETQWSKEVFEDVGLRDLVRVGLHWYVGSGPGAPDMVVDSYVLSKWDDATQTMTDRHTFSGSGAPTEVDRGQPPVLLGALLSAHAQQIGTLRLTTTPGR